METRRITVWIGVIVFLVGVAVLAYFDFRPQAPETPAPASMAADVPDGDSVDGDAGDGEASETAKAPTSAPEPEAADVAAEDGPASDQAAAEPAGDEPAVVADGEMPAEPSDTPVNSEEVAAEVAEGAPTDAPAVAEAGEEQMAEAAPSETPTLSEELDDQVAEAVAPEVPITEEPATDLEDAGQAASPTDMKDADGGTAEVAPSDEPPAAMEAATAETPDVAKEAAEDEVAPANAPVVADTPDDEMAVAAAPEPPADQLSADEVETAMLAPDDADVPPAASAAPAESGEGAPAEDTGLSVDLVPGTASGDPDVVAPSFDIVRVEPTGDAVLAGLAEPGATVELMNGGEAVATAEANERGEWAMALLEPLEPGPHDLALRTTSADKSEVMLSDERVAVMVPEAASEEPLVVLNSPDAPSTVVQVPAGAPEPEETIVAAAPVDAGAPAPDETPVEAPTAEVPADGSDAPTAMETEVAMVPAPDGAPEADEPAAAMAEVPASETDVAGTGSQPEEPAVEPVAQPEEEVEVAVAEPAPEPEPVREVVVTAVEAETTGALFVAGTTTTPENVRVYLDDDLIGEAKPSPSGTWLVEIQREMPVGAYSVRADQVESGSGNVLARAEVPFEREIEVAALKPVGVAGGPAGAEVSGTLGNPNTMIIKRRDNLWRISRRLYGKGIRWSTIYQANKDQIRNPRWIYPGQVFVLPEGNTAWEESGEIQPGGLN